MKLHFIIISDSPGKSIKQVTHPYILSFYICQIEALDQRVRTLINGTAKYWIKHELTIKNYFFIFQLALILRN